MFISRDSGVDLSVLMEFLKNQAPGDVRDDVDVDVDEIWTTDYLINEVTKYFM